VKLQTDLGYELAARGGQNGVLDRLQEDLKERELVLRELPVARVI